MSLEEEEIVFCIDDDIFEKIDDKKDDRTVSKDRSVAVLEPFWFNVHDADKLRKSVDVDLYRSCGFFFNGKYEESK
jgi:hypothetical protein